MTPNPHDKAALALRTTRARLEYFRRFCPVCDKCKKTRLVKGKYKAAGLCGRCLKGEKI